MKQYGEKVGLRLPNYTKPEGVSDADFAQVEGADVRIFNSAVGLGAYAG